MRIRILLVALLAVGAVLAWATGLLERIDPEGLVALLRESGAWGPALFVVMFSCLEAVGVPGIVFLLSSVIVWPEWAFFLNFAGCMGAGCVGFVFARYIARDWVASHMPDRVHRFDARLAERGLRTVIVVRLVFFLFAPSHWALGLSRVRFRDMFLGSLIGFPPWVAFFTFAGVGVFEWLKEQPREVWIGVGVATAGLFLLLRVRARMREPVATR